MSERELQKGDRVVVNERCSWPARRGKRGVVVAVDTEGGGAYVLLDEEGAYGPVLYEGDPDEPWTAKFELYSLTYEGSRDGG